jgi:hypothetical protein
VETVFDLRKAAHGLQLVAAVKSYTMPRDTACAPIKEADLRAGIEGRAVGVVQRACRAICGRVGGVRILFTVSGGYTTELQSGIVRRARMGTERQQSLRVRAASLQLWREYRMDLVLLLIDTVECW